MKVISNPTEKTHNDNLFNRLNVVVLIFFIINFISYISSFKKNKFVEYKQNFSPSNKEGLLKVQTLKNLQINDEHIRKYKLLKNPFSVHK